MGSSSKKSKKESKHKKHKRSSPGYEREDSYSPKGKRRRKEYSDSEDERSKSKKQKKKHRKEERYEKESPDKDVKPVKSERNGGKIDRDVPAGDNSSQDREGAASLSIDESNRLRAKLGLKPLDVGAAAEGQEVKKEEFVHAPAEDLWKKKKEEEMREKLKAIKERRTINKKMGKVKSIGIEDDDLDSASWVRKNRESENRKKEAKKREKVLSEMDREFGISGLVKDELQGMKNQSYTSRDLKGMTIKHSLDSFKEGRTEVLTLADRDVLDVENEDMLVGTSLVDTEKAKRNIDIRSKGSGYQAFEEEEVDELGFYKAKSLLSKYDEEIDGVKQDQFTIGAHGKIDTTWEKQKEEMKKEIRAAGVSLAPPQLQIASEYLTEEEMKFKKRKKKVRKVRKREILKADDLIPLPGDVSTSDLGSRGGAKPGVIPGWDEGIERAKIGDASITSTTLRETKEEANVIYDDGDAGQELEKALSKARRTKFVKAKMISDDTAAEQVSKHLRTLKKVKLENPTANYSTTISLNSTDEFCRQVGTGMESDLHMIKDEPMNTESNFDETPMDLVDDTQEESSGWNEASDKATDKPSVSPEQDDVMNDDGHAPIEAEPLAQGGLAGALKLAGRKGYLLEEKKKNVVTSTEKQRELLNANYSIEDKNAVDHLDKYAHEKYSKDRSGRHDRGMVTEFDEKKNYKPNVKIEYVDDAGRLMNPKEAFRKLSHRFHGKGSGKMKQEKRQKKRLEEDMMMRMSSTDTPLNTVAMMKDKLVAESSPYIVLSGAGKTFQTGGGPMAKK